MKHIGYSLQQLIQQKTMLILMCCPIDRNIKLEKNTNCTEWQTLLLHHIFKRLGHTHWAPSPNLNVPKVMMCYATKKVYQQLITSNKTIAFKTRWLSPENSKQNDISKRAFFAVPYTVNDCYPGKQKTRLSWTKLMYLAKF